MHIQMPRVQRQACRCHVQLQENHEPLFFLVGLAIIVFAFGGTKQKNRESSRLFHGGFTPKTFYLKTI
jgi:hypothetical protein